MRSVIASHRHATPILRSGIRRRSRCGPLSCGTASWPELRQRPSICRPETTSSNKTMGIHIARYHSNETRGARYDPQPPPDEAESRLDRPSIAKVIVFLTGIVICVAIIEARPSGWIYWRISPDIHYADTRMMFKVDIQLLLADDRRDGHHISCALSTATDADCD